MLKLFFSPNPLIQALHRQAAINRYLIGSGDALFYELMHNLVVEMTRTGIEVKNMKMRVESIAGRLDFNERRARALEAVVQYKPEGHGGRSQQGGRGFAAEGQGGAAPPRRDREARLRRGGRSARDQGGAAPPRRDRGARLRRGEIRGRPRSIR